MKVFEIISGCGHSPRTFKV